MKLYTENQMKDAIIESFLSTYPTNGDDILSKFTPIELPSDDEIKYTSELNLVEPYASYWRTGAKWVIEQIKQQDKCLNLQQR